MQTRHHIHRTVLHVALATFLASLISLTTSPTQAALTLGHQVLLEKGLQIETLLMPSYIINAGGTLNVNLYKQSGFTTLNLWNDSGWAYDYFTWRGILPGGSGALKFSGTVNSSPSSPLYYSASYASNLVRVQLGDEQDLTPSAFPGWATQIAALKAQFPNAMVYMNNDEDAYGILSTSTLNSFVQTVKPDMLSFTSYPFRWQAAPYHNYYGGSPTFFYRQVEQYRKAGLAGLTGDGSQPIPVSMFVQTFAHVASTETNHRQPTESEFRLQQFAGWAANMKMVDAFLYQNLPTELDSMFFEGTSADNQTPTTQFYQYAELNRQSLNLGPALVRLISTDFRMKMGSHGSGTTNTLPTGVSAFSTSADPYLKTITATNILGTRNNGLPGDVLYGAFKPLDPSLVAAGDENDKYFMIVNGLSDGVGDADACQQLIHLTFDFGVSGIDSLLRLSRETGLVEEVGLTHVSDSLYTLDLTLTGGTGDLFKYNTGSAFIGTTSVPEPSVIVLFLTGMIGLLAYAWKKRW